MKAPRSRLAAGSASLRAKPLKGKKRQAAAVEATPVDPPENDTDTHPELPPKKRRKEKKAEAAPAVDKGGKLESEATSSPAPPAPPAPAPEGQPGLEVHLQNCPGFFRDHHVHQAFQALGGQSAVAKVKMATRKNTGTFLRAAFVKFYTREQAQQAVAMSPVEIKGKMVQVSWPRPYYDRHSCELFLSGWPKWAKDEDVYGHYAKLGAAAVTEVRWMPHKGN
eukprot:EG_transcript_28939